MGSLRNSDSARRGCGELKGLRGRGELKERRRVWPQERKVRVGWEVVHLVAKRRRGRKSRIERAAERRRGRKSRIEKAAVRRRGSRKGSGGDSLT